MTTAEQALDISQPFVIPVGKLLAPRPRLRVSPDQVVELNDDVRSELEYLAQPRQLAELVQRLVDDGDDPTVVDDLRTEPLIVTLGYGADQDLATLRDLALFPECEYERPAGVSGLAHLVRRQDGGQQMVSTTTVAVLAAGEGRRSVTSAIEVMAAAGAEPTALLRHLYIDLPGLVRNGTGYLGRV